MQRYASGSRIPSINSWGVGRKHNLLDTRNAGFLDEQRIFKCAGLVYKGGQPENYESI